MASLSEASAWHCLSARRLEDTLPLRRLLAACAAAAVGCCCRRCYLRGAALAEKRQGRPSSLHRATPPRHPRQNARRARHSPRPRCAASPQSTTRAYGLSRAAPCWPSAGYAPQMAACARRVASCLFISSIYSSSSSSSSSATASSAAVCCLIRVVSSVLPVDSCLSSFCMCMVCLIVRLFCLCSVSSLSACVARLSRLRVSTAPPPEEARVLGAPWLGPPWRAPARPLVVRRRPARLSARARPRAACWPRRAPWPPACRHSGTPASPS